MSAKPYQIDVIAKAKAGTVQPHQWCRGCGAMCWGDRSDGLCDRCRWLECAVDVLGHDAIEERE